MRNASTPTPPLAQPQLYVFRRLRRRHFNRLFAFVYSLAILCLLYRHLRAVLTTAANSFTPLLLFIADAILGYMWSTTQSFRMNPVVREELPGEKLHLKDLPKIDIFICTADPFKEPPMVVVNTALSVMAYNYPSEKLSVYVSDDGGSELTMFALMEAAKFAKYWVQFCKDNNIVDRNPEAYFNTGNSSNLEIKALYDAMKLKVETAVDNRKVSDGYISGEDERRILSQFSVDGFSRQQHPPIIQVLLNSNKDKLKDGGPAPNLIYVSREKNRTFPHHFKAGALNALVRVSACMTNSPIILTLDCDMFSNDPSTILNALGCFGDRPEIGYVQFPQRFRGLNEADTYACEHKRLFRLNPSGMDGLNGPSYVGTGCFFSRRALFGGPSSYVRPEDSTLEPNSIVDRSIDDPLVLEQSQCVARSDYDENNTSWGSKMGFRYGSIVEDYYTGYRLQCEGWHSVFCDPKRAAFLGDVPICLNDALNQTQRWAVGLLEVGFSRVSPITFGVKYMGLLMGQSYAHYAFWAIWCIPVAIYAFLPPLALLRGICIFPKVKDPWFYIYAFLFLGAYGQDCFDFVTKEGTLARWWSDQRMWLIRSLSSYLFGSIEYASKRLGFASHAFNITSKVEDEEKRKRYDQGLFEFEVASPLYVPMVAASILNLVAFLAGLRRGGEDMFLQTVVAGFAVANAVPVYGAMVWRGDGGRVASKTVAASVTVVGLLFGVACVLW